MDKKAVFVVQTRNEAVALIEDYAKSMDIWNSKHGLDKEEGHQVLFDLRMKMIGFLHVASQGLRDHGVPGTADQLQKAIRHLSDPKLTDLEVANYFEAYLVHIPISIN